MLRKLSYLGPRYLASNLIKQKKVHYNWLTPSQLKTWKYSQMLFYWEGFWTSWQEKSNFVKVIHILTIPGINWYGTWSTMQRAFVKFYQSKVWEDSYSLVLYMLISCEKSRQCIILFFLRRRKGKSRYLRHALKLILFWEWF